MAVLSKLEAAVMGLVSIGFILAIGIALLVQLQGTQTADTVEYNATGDIIDGVLLIVGFIGVIVLALIAAPLLGLIRATTQGMQG